MTLPDQLPVQLGAGIVDPATGFEIPTTGFFTYGTLVLKRYLSTRVPQGYVVTTNVPNPRPGRFILVQGSVPGARRNDNSAIVLSNRRNIIQCFDTSEARVNRVAEIVRGYLVDGKYTRRSGYRDIVFIGEPAFFPDPTDPANTPRAQLTVDITLRARYTPDPTTGL